MSLARRVVIALAAFPALAFTAPACEGQGFPLRPVRIMVGFSAGGPDTSDRLAQQLSSQTQNERE